ncbi:hypothetical protein DIPPA_14649 [Diplonema papillatum]|nr:hypothetical protein DIPPA_14649 [Diplonema papillatum]
MTPHPLFARPPRHNASAAPSPTKSRLYDPCIPVSSGVREVCVLSFTTRPTLPRNLKDTGTDRLRCVLSQSVSTAHGGLLWDAASAARSPFLGPLPAGGCTIPQAPGRGGQCANPRHSGPSIVKMRRVALCWASS